jgi:hypothetical protein
MMKNFGSVQKQFAERDVRTDQAAIATKIAVDAALQAQKEAAGAQNESNSAAITKSEAASAKQMDGIQALLQSESKATGEKFDDIKTTIASLDTRLTALASHGKGATDNMAWILVIIMAAIALSSLAVNFFRH